ncbi:hypothetical protein ADL08_21455 [Streptomyces sp. NRRL F-6492]|nr:hypothetical protein ADL08_21455 [Streptomyces sp. NRRL F-6492]
MRTLPSSRRTGGEHGVEVHAVDEGRAVREVDDVGQFVRDVHEAARLRRLRDLGHLLLQERLAVPGQLRGDGGRAAGAGAEAEGPVEGADHVLGGGGGHAVVLSRRRASTAL